MPARQDAHLDEFHRDQQWHKPVRVATTANVTISTALNAGDTIDGVTLAAGDRVLVKNQSTGAENGIYIAGATPARAYDMLYGIQAMGAFVYVIAGTANGGKVFYNTNTTLPTIDTTALTWSQFTGGAGGGVATDTIWDAKGDLAVGTGADTASKLTAGSNDTVLMADSAQSTGLKWVASQTPTTQAFSDSAAEGTADTYARGDHKHGMPADPGGGGGSVSVEAVYGYGSDGNVTISSPTMLSRDMYYNDLTVNSTLDANGWRIFVKGTLSGSGSIISNAPTAGNGGNGTGAAGGAAGNAGAATNSNNLGRGSQGIAGRVGGFNAVGLAGTGGQTSSMFRADGTGLNHPVGAAGGNGTSAGGGGAAASTGTNTLEPKPAYYPICINWRDPIAGAALSTNDISGRPSGSGSGGGGSGAGGGGSGGTGAGGGPIVLCARTWSGTVAVQSRGGNGGNGGNGFASGAGAAGGGGGGNGGPGGTVVAIYKDRSGWSGTIDANGGSGGSAGSGGNGGASGGGGSTGPAGQVLEFKMG